MSYPLITDEQRTELLANGARTASGEEIDPYPVVRLFTPDAGAAWLLTELDPTDHDLAFGLCDLGLGYPELGYIRLSEIASVRGRSVSRSNATCSSRPIRRSAVMPTRRSVSGLSGRLFIVWLSGSQDVRRPGRARLDRCDAAHRPALVFPRRHGVGVACL
jgi:hypothetical protein